MMMSRIVPYLLAALNCIVFVSASTAFGAVVKNHDLAEVISQYHDTHMVVEDLSYSLPLTTTTQHPKMAVSKPQSKARFIMRYQTAQLDWLSLQW